MKLLKKVLFICSLFALNGVSYALPPSVPDTQLTLSSLLALLDKLIKAQPEKKHLDGETIIASHKRFIELLDPEKSYFLEEEICPFIDPAKQKEYADEFANGSYQSYKDIGEVFQRAIQRSQGIRKRFQGKSFSSKEINLNEFAKTEEQLDAKVFWLFFASRPERKRTIADLERQEHLWSTYDEELLAQTILKSILSMVDINSDVMGQRDARIMREKLTKQAVGTGIICEAFHDRIRIAHIQKGSPAAKMGAFHRGDILLSIDRKECLHMSLDEVDELLREKDTGSVLIAWEDIRGEIFEKSVPLQSFILEEGRVQGQVHGNILVLTVPSLYSNGRGISTTQDIAKILIAAQQQTPVSGLILDLRVNGGGYLTEAISTCGLFLRTGVVMTAVFANGKKAVYRDTDPRIFFDGPILILISEKTASAAEIVAQTLKDYGKAIVVGSERTFGKGSIQMQTVTDVKGQDDIPLRYTVGKFYSVSGVSPNGTGVEADIVLPGFQKQAIHGVSAETLPDTVPAQFHDKLDDIKGPARKNYQKYYIPYVQKREYRYRKLIPLLKEKSQHRSKKLLFASFIQVSAETSTEKQAFLEQIAAAQLEEAENILKDLIDKTE